MAGKIQERGYEGRLSMWGDEMLDAMATAERPKREVAPKPDTILGTCPSCGHTRQLRKGHVAVLCDECHAGIGRYVEEHRNG